MSAFEANFDGLVGPTHNYAGLSWGNVASTQNKSRASSPKRAALQGLEKMRALHELGMAQAVLPPQQRPFLPLLRDLGFTGSDRQLWETAWRKTPEIAAICASSSAMWVANAATISPGFDCADGRTHITPANLSSLPHRAIEAQQTTRVLRKIFNDSRTFTVHEPLPALPGVGDEGAANHTRLCPQYDRPGIEQFVYGIDPQKPNDGPKRYPARQNLRASEALARRHQLTDRAVLVHQNPNAIDAGVFHNDVIAVGNLNIMFHHELAYADPDWWTKLKQKADFDLVRIEVPADQVSLEDAVSSYLFNSQLIGNDPHQQTLIAPEDCRRNSRVSDYFDWLLEAKTPITQVRYFDLRESMRNGGGPACLRLRVVLTPEEWHKLGGAVRYDDSLHTRLKQWIDAHYRDELTPEDLRDPDLVDESFTALDELTQILQLGSVYPFQQ